MLRKSVFEPSGFSRIRLREFYTFYRLNCESREIYSKGKQIKLSNKMMFY